MGSTDNANTKAASLISILSTCPVPSTQRSRWSKGDRTINLGPKNKIRAKSGDQVITMRHGGGEWGDSKDSKREVNGVRAVQYQRAMGSVAASCCSTEQLRFELVSR